jgi:hypothetical protein
MCGRRNCPVSADTVPDVHGSGKNSVKTKLKFITGYAHVVHEII